MTQFAFLTSDFPDLLARAKKAESSALSDPRGACFWARLTLETAVKWVYRNDPSMRSPYQDTLAALIAEPSLAQLTGPAMVTSAVVISAPDTREGHEDTDEAKTLEVQTWWKMNVGNDAETYETDVIERFSTDGAPDILIVVD